MKPSMIPARHVALLAVALAGLVGLTGPARADAIDGEWCYKDGRRMSIHGPELITPAGTRMQGDYDRHGFAYVVPANEAAAGTKVFMVLLDEYTVYLWTGTPQRPQDQTGVEVWNRCQEKTS